jgi:RNA polymerase sigma-70 factor (ECF subfamily)
MELSDVTFLKYVGERLSPGEDPIATLQALHASDLYVACGCSLGDPHAIMAFEHHYVSQISPHLARSDSLPATSQELRQLLRERVLVAQDRLLPRIASYNGRGPLAGWLRMVAARLVIDLRRAQKKEGVRDQGFALPLSALDPEIAYLKERYRKEFEDALEKAFDDLSVREKTIMRLYFLEEVGTAGIATMYQVSGRTVQRWIAATQASILARTRKILTEKLALSAGELDSLLGLVRSQLSVSLHRFLKKSSPG